MRKLALTLTILIFLSGLVVGSAIAEEEVKVPLNAVKSSCYGQIDMSKAEFLLSEVGKECVKDSWLEANISENEKREVKTEDKESNTDDVTWQVYSIDDISLGQTKKFEYRVVIDGAVSPEELKKVGKQVIEKAKKETPFNALVIFFYDYPEYAHTSYTLAKATMAPDGEYKKADTVNTGNYKAMEVNWNDIRKKDWDDQLTPEEAEIWGYWDKLLWEEMDKSEDEIAKMVAEEFDITPERVKSIADKKFFWEYQDLSD